MPVWIAIERIRPLKIPAGLLRQYGGVAEWSKATDLKSAEHLKRLRGFESLPLFNPPYFKLGHYRFPGQTPRSRIIDR